MDNEKILLRNNVKVTGCGSKALLFAHGFGCDQNMWRFIVPAFEEKYNVILFDFVGSGRSDIQAYDPSRYRDLNGYAQDILDVCSALELEDVILVGHSVGATIGMLASIQRPDYFERLVMIGPSARYMNDLPDYIGGFEREDLVALLDMMDQNFQGWANYLAPVIMGNKDRPELSEELEMSFCATDPQIARYFAEATFLSDYRKELGQVAVPSLILQCSDDMIAPLEAGAYVHQQIKGSEFRLMEATGHCPHLSHPEETIRLIREYLAAVELSQESELHM
ncbi:Pimeloyl-ACP methyl ester carboxylesterase [Paenibacillus sp. UNCCL117]|uniref:alpha/beta fold hydrolase n=1 Tax=unclassified Paenibacillus TaxID=185978 RepID=UPI0008886A4E|nr:MULTISPECIES: alpha/beta hydrolase [unclassified Paenibacillus]SDE22563.1 Pimeloyl-ACP methyl ester carboxylesterase [Paenibacillus sp. cl123]SFW42924.1 Pimeloyl-ACP methyl ester carboxylesterase [Paenibacillus sp. UNCCL117]